MIKSALPLAGGLALALFLLVPYSISYGQLAEKGIIGQIIGDDKTQFYVKSINASQENGDKLVRVLAVFKNTDAVKQVIYPSTVRLVDSQSREYEPEYSSKYPTVSLPSNDILTWVGEFKIQPTNTPSKIYFTPDGSEARLTVDLTKPMNPSQDPPKSDWTLSSNKGVKITNRQLEITINDEKYIGNTYVIDVTIKNIGSAPFHYDAYDFQVKDSDGFAYSHNVFYDLLSPLMSGDLPQNEMVRGDIAFDVNKPSGNMMVIVASGYSGVPFLNTGTSTVQNASKTSQKTIEIALGSSNPNNGDSYVPKALSASKGSVVIWTNEDQTLHTVTSGSPEAGNGGEEFDSSYIAAGGSFEHTFNTTGTFDYYCTLHPFMKGQIIVK